MSKADGQFIKMRFTEKLTNSFDAVLGYLYTPNSGVIVTVSGGGSDIAKIANGNYSDYGYVTNAAGRWIQLQLPSAKVAKGMRWYVNSANYGFNAFTISASNDGTNFTVLGEFNDTNTTGWKAFSLDNSTAYLYYRFTSSTYYGSYFFINEIELKSTPYRNEYAFSVSGQEYNMEPDGVLTNQSYDVLSVERYPGDDYSILLAVKPLDRFERVNGNLTVAYDATKGSLAGYGGPVASFSVQFAPSDLVNKPHPHDAEHIAVTGLDAAGTLTRIYYSNTKEDEHIEISHISAVGTLTHINDL